MSKNVLILSCSPRKHGNSDTLCDEFEKGAVEKGNNVKKIFIQDKNINFCLGCDSCQSHDGKCVHKDDMADILSEIINADVIVFASPVYFYSVAGQLKTVIDRCYAKYTRIRNKEFYIIATAAENARHTFDRTIECVRGYIDCITGGKEKGIITAGGVWKKGDVKSTKYMQLAYDMGKSI